MEYYFLKVPAINALRKQLFLFAHQQSKAPVSTGENGEELVNPASQVFAGNVVASLAAHSKADGPDGRDGKAIGRDQQRVACALVETSVFFWARFLQYVAKLIESKEYKGLVITKRRKYDETSLRIRTIEKKAESQSQDPDRLCETENAGAPAKIFQTEFQISCLLMKLEDGSMRHFVGRVPTCLQSVESCDARTVLAVHAATEDVVPNLESVRSLFDVSVSLPCSDRHPSNIVSENLFHLQRPGWVKAHSFCSIHRVSTCMKSALSLVDGHVSGVLSIGQCLAVSGSTQKLRKYLFEIIKDKLQVHAGHPTHSEHRQFIYNTFLNPAVNVARNQATQSQLKQKQRYILDKLFNGDIQQQDVIIHNSMPLRDRELVLADFAKYAIPALIPHQCPRLNRGSFLGHDAAFSWVGLIENHHSLLQPLLFRYCSFEAAVPKPLPVQDGTGLEAWSAIRKRHGSSQAQADASEVDGLPLVDIGEQDAKHEAQVDENMSWADLNRATKRKAALYISCGPGPLIAMLQWVLYPIQRLMTDYIFLSSWKWEQLQNQIANDGGRRSFRVLELFVGKQTQVFFETVGALFANPCVDLPTRALRLSFQALSFRILSRAGSSVEALVVDWHRGCPHKLFGALVGAVQEIFNTPPCMRDELTEAFIAKFPSETDMGSPKCMAMLASIAHCMDNDILSIESRHSSSRRLVYVKSTQTWALQFCQLNAEWTSRQHVCETERLFGNVDSGIPPGTDDHLPCTETQRKPRRVRKLRKGKALNKGRGGHGGTWRAFLHKKYTGTTTAGEKSQFDFSRSSAEYQAIKRQKGEEWQALVSLGQLTTEAGRRRIDAFEPHRHALNTLRDESRNALSVSTPGAASQQVDELGALVKAAQKQWRFDSAVSRKQDEGKVREVQASMLSSASKTNSDISHAWGIETGDQSCTLLSPGSGKLPDVITLQVPAARAVEDCGSLEGVSQSSDYPVKKWETTFFNT